MRACALHPLLKKGVQAKRLDSRMPYSWFVGTVSGRQSRKHSTLAPPETLDPILYRPTPRPQTRTR